MANRRGNNEGSIYRRKIGYWVGQYGVQTAEGAKTRYIYGNRPLAGAGACLSLNSWHSPVGWQPQLRFKSHAPTRRAPEKLSLSRPGARLRYALAEAGRKSQVRAGTFGARGYKPYPQCLQPRVARHGRRHCGRDGGCARLAPSYCRIAAETPRRPTGTFMLSYDFQVI